MNCEWYFIHFFSLFQHTKRHYHYLEDTYPHLLPSSKKEKLNNNFETTNCAKFAKQIVSNVSSAATLKTEAKVKVLSRSCQDLEKLASIEPSLGDAAIFAQTYIKCQILMLKCLSGENHDIFIQFVNSSLRNFCLTKLSVRQKKLSISICFFIQTFLKYSNAMISLHLF